MWALPTRGATFLFDTRDGCRPPGPQQINLGEAHKCLRDSSAGSLGDKQEELEAMGQQESCDILAIMEHGG